MTLKVIISDLELKKRTNRLQILVPPKLKELDLACISLHNDNEISFLEAQDESSMVTHEFSSFTLAFCTPLSNPHSK